jgi:hypothetical protein
MFKLAEMNIDVIVSHRNDRGDFSELLKTTIDKLRDMGYEVDPSDERYDRENKTFTDSIQIGCDSVTVGERSYDEVGNYVDGEVGTMYAHSDEDIKKLDQLFDEVKSTFDHAGCDILQGNWNNIDFITIEKGQVTFALGSDDDDEDN